MYNGEVISLDLYTLLLSNSSAMTVQQCKIVTRLVEVGKHLAPPYPADGTSFSSGSRKSCSFMFEITKVELESHPREEH